MADTSFRALPPPNPKQPQLPLRGTNRTIWMASSHRRHPLDPPQCLVHAEHEILIFLYFERRESIQARVAGLVDHAYRAFAELLENRVVRDGLAGYGSVLQVHLPQQGLVARVVEQRVGRR